MNHPHFDPISPVVYIIDDHPNDSLIVRRLCESVGLTAQTYDSPTSFLADVKRDQRGCIVADLMMPEMTGLQLHAELQNANSELPIIVLTGHADATTCRTAFRNGVFDYVEKGFNPHDLLVVIRAAIDQNARQSRERLERSGFQKQLDVLSPREREAMALLADGLTLKEIANQFGISVQTASKHRSSLFEKLGVSNEIELLKLLIKIDPAIGSRSTKVNDPSQEIDPTDGQSDSTVAA